MPRFRKKTFTKKTSNSKTRVGNIKKIEDSIIKTLSYRSVFDYPLSFYQLSHYLISKNKIEHSDFKKALDYLLRTRKISEKKGKYYLYRSKTVNWDVRKRNSEKLIKKAQDITSILKRIPWIQFVGVTGAIAAFNAPKNDDIDLIIITKRNRLWITRGFTFLILKVIGELRSDRNPDRKICPNILMDEGHLSWSKSKRNVYIAHELVMTYPIFDRGNIYFKLLKNNDWVFKYFGNMNPETFDKTPEKYNKNIVLLKVEDLARKLQIKYMEKKKTNEITNKFLIHFNRDDSTNPILEEYKRIHQRVK